MGGVRFDINDDLKKHILSLLNHVKKDFKELTRILCLHLPLCWDRLETTGRLSTEIAQGLGVAGVAEGLLVLLPIPGLFTLMRLMTK